MLFVLFCLDKPIVGPEIRRKTRAAHLEFVVKNTEIFRYGGALLDEEQRMAGSLMMVALPDRAALDRFLKDEPYNRAGLYEAVIVRATRQVVPEPEPGFIKAELERERSRAN